MKYQVQQISYDYRTFQDIEECTWDFTTSEIHTNKGTLDILGFQEVEQNGQVGVQMDVDGWLDLDEYVLFSPIDGPVNIRTLAIMRKPHNVWLWVYMFNETNQPVAAFCGTDGFDEINSFAKYVKELKRIADGGIVDGLGNYDGDTLSDDFTPSAEERATGRILADGKKYNGWGYYRNGQFIPHGCGKKYYPGFYVYGNFNNGVLNGPAINSHGQYMYTMFFKQNRGNGWGLCINGGFLVEFGYYENSQLKVDLTDFVQWYYEGILSKSERIGESMLYMYSSKETKMVTILLIGYAPKKVSESMTLLCMGFRFKADGSVWVGTGNLNNMTGHYMHFRPDGCIDIGSFNKGSLEERMSLQELIDLYFGITKIREDSPIAEFFRNRPKSSFQLGREYDRNQYCDIEEPKVNFNYFTGTYNDDNDKSDELPF